MDLPSANYNLYQLTVALLNGDPTVAESVRSTLAAMGNGEDDISRIFGLLRQPDVLAAQPPILHHHLLNETNIPSPSLSSPTMGMGHSWSVQSGASDDDRTPSSSRQDHIDATIEDRSTNIASRQATRPHGLINTMLHTQSLRRTSPSSIHEFLVQADQQQQEGLSSQQQWRIVDRHLRAMTGDELQDHSNSVSLLSSLRRKATPHQQQQQQQQHMCTDETSTSCLSSGSLRHQQQYQNEVLSNVSPLQDSLTIGPEPTSLKESAEIQMIMNNDNGVAEVKQDDDRSDLFPFILHDLLRDLERANQTSVASWYEQGDSFQIHKEDVFCEKLLRLYFHLDTMKDFCLVLESWGFKTHVDKCGGNKFYSHPDFQRDSPGLPSLMRMKRLVTRSPRYPLLTRKRALSGKIVDGIDDQNIHKEAEGSRRPILPSEKLVRRDELVDTTSGLCGRHPSKRSKHVPFGGGFVEKDKCHDSKRNESRSLSPPAQKAVSEPNHNFLTKLRRLLEKSEYDAALKKVIRWSPRGLSFEVHDRHAFVDNFLCECMEKRNYEAFQYVLRRWGFQRIKEGSDEGAHFHRLFQRDKPSLDSNMTPKQMRDAMSAQTQVSTMGEFFPCDVEVSQQRQQNETDDKSSLASVHNSENGGSTDEASLNTRQDKRVVQGKTSVSVGVTVYSNDRAETSAPDSTRREATTTTNSTSVDEKVCVKSEVFEQLDAHENFRVNHIHDSHDVSGLMFPWQLHQMLDDTDQVEDLDRAIGWNPDGASFFVQNHDKVVTTLIPKYFGLYMSWNEFTAELSNWGFVCFTAGPQKGSFIHRLLSKGKPSLCKQMRYKGKTVADMLKNKTAFLLRLHETLSLVKTVRDSPVSWSVDGSSFFITDPTSFLQNIFSIYYESMSVASFEQKLRSWGFVKRPTDISVRVSAENVTYSHPCFTRDKKPLIQRIQSDMNAESISVEQSFLVRLRIMLDDAEKHGHQTIVSWLPHGKSFMIHDRAFFSDYFLPHYFKTKLTSFRQTLRSNGFAQMGGKGWDSGSYYHKLFVKDDPCRCQGLNPDAMKKAMPEWIHPQDEPNFYAETLAGGSSDQDHGYFSKMAEQSVELVDDPPKCNTKVPVTFLSLPKGEEAESVSAVVERKKPAAHAP